MKDGTEYAKMLEMPLSSCDVIIKHAKRRKKKNAKEELIAKVNFEAENEKPLCEDEVAEESEPTSEEPRRKKRKFFKKPLFKFDVIYAEGIAVFLLVATILLTNIFWEDSGINTLFKSTFGNAEKTDARTYLSFSAKLPSDELDATLAEGVMTFSGKGALYPVCDGKVEKIATQDDKYTVTISHSDLFKTVVSGMDYVYAEEGEEVYKYIPIGYIGGGSAEVTMYNDGVLLTGYLLESGSIVWES
ncbi:MAG: hypothetical protein IJS67_00660 [Clostridia bacterium]|nr:hypothetical protein [Clostridia bacterium]